MIFYFNSMEQLKYLISIFLILIFVSCKENKRDSVSFWDVGEYMPETKEDVKSVSDWDKFEAEVFQSIDSIETSTLLNRKARIEKFLSYSDRVDGAISEAYFVFALKYPSDKNMYFFAVFEESDTVLLDRWAILAANELANNAFNLPEEKDLIKDYEKEFRVNSSILNPKEKKLAFWYIEKVIAYTIAKE